LRAKLLLYLVLPAFLVLAATFSIWAYRSLQASSQAATFALQQQAYRVAGALEQHNLQALNTARTMALAQENGLFGQRLPSSRYARAVLAEHPHFLAAYFAYEPDADGQDQVALSVTEPDVQQGLDAEGRFLPYWHRSQEQPEHLALEPVKDMATSEYYQGPRRKVRAQASERGTVTDPYAYYGVQMVEFTYPIVLADRFQGIAGVDMGLVDIERMLYRLAPDTDLLLLSASGRVIASTRFPEVRTLPAAQTAYHDVLQALQAAPTEVLMAPLAGRSAFYTRVEMPHSGWQLIASRDRAAVLQPVYRDFAGVSLLALLAFVAVSLLAVGVAQRLGQRIGAMADLLRELSRGNLGVQLQPPHGRSDEISLMYQSCSELVSANCHFEEQCTRVAVGDYSLRMEPRGPHDGLARAINTMADARQQVEEELRQQAARLSTALTDLSAAQALVLGQEKMAALGRLVAGVAHELNTPIGNARMVASTLADHHQTLHHSVATGLKRSALQDYVQQAEACTELLLRNLARAAELLASFKQVAVEHGGHQRSDFDLDELVQDVVQALQPLLRQHRCTLEVDVPSEVGLDSYPGPLSQVLHHLLHNALLHAYPSDRPDLARRILLQARRLPGAEAELVVQDFGVGIETGHLGKVFDPFFTTRLGQGGSGLGLSIVYNLVRDLLGGQVEVSSVPGQGARFVVRVPLRAPVATEKS